MSVYRFFREIERGVFVLVEVDGAVYDAHPLSVGVADGNVLAGEKILHPFGYHCAVLLLGSVPVGAASAYHAGLFLPDRWQGRKKQACKKY